MLSCQRQVKTQDHLSGFPLAHEGDQVTATSFGGHDNCFTIVADAFLFQYVDGELLLHGLFLSVGYVLGERVSNFRLADREYLSARIYEHNSQVPADRYFEPRTMMYENALILHLLLILPSSRRRSQVEIVLYYTDKNYFANESTKKLPVRELIGNSGGS